MLAWGSDHILPFIAQGAARTAASCSDEENGLSSCLPWVPLAQSRVHAGGTPSIHSSTDLGRDTHPNLVDRAGVGLAALCPSSYLKPWCLTCMLTSLLTLLLAHLFFGTLALAHCRRCCAR